MVNPIITQMLYYAILSVMIIMGCGFFLRGFFWKYCKVRTSFGKLIMVKLRTSLRDYFEIGRIENGMLVFKNNKEEKRIALDQKDKIFYRCLAVNWIDIDEEKNAVCKTDYSTVAGFDSSKFSDLLKRALMRPSVSDNKEKLMLLGIIALIILTIIGIYFSYKNYSTIAEFKSVIAMMIAQSKQTIVASSTI